MDEQNTIMARQSQALFIDLYQKLFPAVAKFIARKGGSFDDAKDVFQDSLIIYYEKVIAGKIICANEQAYLMGIAKHLWLRKFSSNRELPLNELVSANILDMEDEQLAANKLLQYLETAGRKCMDLLKAFYYDQLPLNDLADGFGFSSVRSATVQKYRCLQKVRETVKQKSLQYDDFVE